MLIVVHRKPHPWTVRDLGLATGLAGQLATALQNARLYASVRSLASRLTAIHELSLRLAQLRDVDAIGEAIVAEVGRLVDCDTVRVYRLEPEGHFFRPVAASGTFAGVESPPLETLTSGQTETLPGWVAKRNEPLIIPDASVERRSIFRTSLGPESLLLVPMSYGDAVQGVLVVSKEGVDRYGPDDEQALSIFGRYAAQAIVNADNIEQLERQHILLERQLAAERRLLDLSEQLVSTLDPRRVLEQIAETIGVGRPLRPADDLSPARARQAVSSRCCPGRTPGIRPIRRRKAAAFDEGLTSWVIGRGRRGLRQRRRRGRIRARSGRRESDSFWPQGIGQDGGPARCEEAARHSEHHRRSAAGPRRGGGQPEPDPSRRPRGSLQRARVRAQQAIRGSGVDRPPERRGPRDRGHPGRPGRADRSAEPRDVPAGPGVDDRGGQAVLAADDGPGLLQGLQRHVRPSRRRRPAAGRGRRIVSAIRQNDSAYRYGGDEFALLLIGASSGHAEEVAARVRRAVREGVRESQVGGLGPEVSASIGASHWPADGPAAAALVEAADAALYRAKRIRSEQNAVDVAAAEPARSLSVSDALVEAAHDLAGAATREEVAQATACHAAALCGATDAFVAFLNGGPAAGGPAGSRGASSVAHKPRLRTVAASGRFRRRAPTLQSDDGLWRRVLDEESLREEAGRTASFIGAPLAIAGTVAGLVGIVVPAAVSAEARSGLRQLTAVASAAFERTSRSA